MKGVFVGLLIIGCSVAMLIYSNNLVGFFGVSDRAERKLGSTRNIYVLLGVFGILIGCLFLFGVLDFNDMSGVMDIKTNFDK